MIEAFQEVILESTKAILGCPTLTHEHIMALPTVDQSSSCPGVYLICFTKPNDQRLQVPSGLYVGSSIKSVSERCRGHSAEFKRIAGKKLDDDRCSPKGTRWMYVYYYAYKYGLVPSYRQIAIFPEKLEVVGFPHPDTRWLVRMLEHLMILLLDAYEPSQSSKSSRYGYTNEMHLEVLTECGVPKSIFHPLNHAMPLKQKCGWTTGARVCRNCGNKSTAAHWYYDLAAWELAVLYNCSACYWYRFRNNADRPPDLFIAFRARPVDGPCSNCQATESPSWNWHPRDIDGTLCAACCTHWGRYGVDRPPKRE
ncbi:unnamed protein product [Penicillium nalgiovense]|nr:unnamed protein product [Penicillium nalgiovense]